MQDVYQKYIFRFLETYRHKRRVARTNHWKFPYTHYLGQMPEVYAFYIVAHIYIQVGKAFHDVRTWKTIRTFRTYNWYTFLTLKKLGTAHFVNECLLAHFHMYVLFKWIDIQQCQCLLPCIVGPIWRNNFSTNRACTPMNIKICFKGNPISITMDRLSYLVRWKFSKCALLSTHVEDPE